MMVMKMRVNNNSFVEEDLRKVRSIFNPNDIYYTSSKWDSKQVDGVTFMPVVSKMPGGAYSRRTFMRKDNMEFLR